MVVTGRTRHLSDRWVLLAFFVVGCLSFGGCGSQETHLQSELVGTEWVIVEMTGFPDDNVVVGNFGFTNQRFSYYDGVNHTSSEIMWNETGFTVKAGGTSTAVLAHDGYPGPYFDTLVPVRARVEIVRNTDGSLTLTRDELTVTAEPA